MSSIAYQVSLEVSMAVVSWDPLRA